MNSVNVIIGLIMILSFFGMIWYCVKGYNLMIGFFVMAIFWTGLALVGNKITPNASMAKLDFIGVLTNVFQDGPQNYGKSILVNVFFGAFFGRILMSTGIASTLIRKTVELGGDKPRVTMTLLCVTTSVIFTTMTGIGPVISIAVIVIPILLSLGLPANITLFAFMGSIMSGIFANVVNFNQYQAMFVAANSGFSKYTYNDYFKFGIICMIVTIVVVLIVANISLNNNKISHAWAAKTSAGSADNNAPAISWFAVILPVIGVVAFKFPIILGFLVSGFYALITCGKLKGSFTNICSMLAKLFADGAVDVAPMVGFLLMLSMFNNAAIFAAPYFQTLLGNFIPTSTLIIAIVFAILTPLGFFRGPLNLVGCGAAILVVVISSPANFPIAFLYPLFAVTTIAPQHLDITQSWVAWGFGYTRVTTKDYMKMSIPTGWIVGFICCIIAYFMYGGLVG